ncbi:class I SAM-dependent methyltransferase [Nocardiopsis exhalans]|uniref:Class I SAM-dependent methyltransferase n=1 Tax=Nocardiopsis exhalans TaxID=163604 RepID=A0ABY5D3Y0_9ACTN|nr:class I SAM-dependent methyltransferase [Nocardiopsis exhalans]USY19069.1 class I SAM-dependent methyltransferase [Nocardiopsis exhalans]
MGTGRLALPIAAHGLTVHGVDASERMLQRLAERDTDQLVRAHHATFTTLDLDLRFDTVLAAYNALCCAPAQEEQLEVMRNIRRHVRDGGHVVIETYDPQIHLTGPDTATSVRPLGPGRVMFESTQVVPATQTVFMTSVLLTGGAPDVTVGFMRYVWPSEIDLMARAVGLEPVGRYAGWGRTEYTGNGQMCVSVYRAVGEPGRA